MSTEVLTAPPETSVADAAAQMVRRRFGSVVVQQGKVVFGIFTERDALRAAASGKDLNGEAVSRWMTEDPMTVGPDVDTEEAAGTMLANGFRHLPVVDADGLVGIVSLRDVLSTRIGRRTTQ